MSLNIQIYLLIHTILYGVFLGLCFDTLELLGARVKKKLCQDFLIILYWAMQIPLTVLFFHHVNRGEFQSYLFIFVLLGGLGYFKFFRNKYLKDLKTLLEVCFQMYKCIKKVLNVLIFKPIVFIFKIIFDIMVIPKKIFRKKQSDESKKGFKQGVKVQGN